MKITFPDGRDALKIMPEDVALREDAETQKSVRVQFASDNVEYDFALKLLPSIFSDKSAVNLTSGANVSPKDLEPPAYGDGHAVFTLGKAGFVNGVVWDADGGTISFSNSQNGGSNLDVVRTPRNESHHGWCGTDHTYGMHTSSVEPQVDRDATVHEDGDGDRRHRRAYDEWWGNGDCYPNDDVTTAAKIGIAIGYKAYQRWGETIAGVTNELTATIQTVNVVVRRDVVVAAAAIIALCMSMPFSLFFKKKNVFNLQLHY